MISTPKGLFGRLSELSNVGNQQSACQFLLLPFRQAKRSLSLSLTMTHALWEAHSSPTPKTPKTSLSSSKCDRNTRDCHTREFRKLCLMVAENPSYNTKTQIIQDFLQKGSAGGWASSILGGLPQEAQNFDQPSGQRELCDSCEPSRLV